MSRFSTQYFKSKLKYLELKQQLGGVEVENDPNTTLLNFYTTHLNLYTQQLQLEETKIQELRDKIQELTLVAKKKKR